MTSDAQREQVAQCIDSSMLNNKPRHAKNLEFACGEKVTLWPGYWGDEGGANRKSKEECRANPRAPERAYSANGLHSPFLPCTSFLQ
jgi:hypothetical protein